MPNSPTRITQELELANMNHAKRWLQNLPTRIDHITARTRSLQYSWRTIEWWHRRNQAPKIKVGRSRRLSPTPCSLLFLVGCATKERPKCTESRTRVMFIPNCFVSVVWGIVLWCNIKHAASQLKLVLTSPETTWDSTLGLISSSFLVAGSIYLKRT